MLTEALTSSRTKARTRVPPEEKEGARGERGGRERAGEGGRDIFVLGPSCEKVPDPVCVCKPNLHMAQGCIQQLILCTGHIGPIPGASNISLHSVSLFWHQSLTF